MTRIARMILICYCVAQIRFPVEVASDRGEGGDGAPEGLQSETAREYPTGARGRPLPVHRQFGRKLDTQLETALKREPPRESFAIRSSISRGDLRSRMRTERQLEVPSRVFAVSRLASKRLVRLTLFANAHVTTSSRRTYNGQREFRNAPRHFQRG